MKYAIRLCAFLLFVAAGCGDGERSLGEQGGAAISDTRAVEEAQAAANKIVRNASDCELVKAEIDGVIQTLDSVDADIQTKTGRTTMDTLREQVRRVAEACGAPIS